MFGSSSAFGQSSGNPFGSQSGFGQANNQANNPFAPKPFGSTTPFGSQSGSSIFGSTSTGVFGTTQPSSPLSATPAFGASSSPAFGASTTAFGNSSASFGGSSVFGQKPAFGGFGSSTQSSPFGSTFQPSQPAFGSNVFGSSAPFGASSQPAFGANTGLSFGSSSSPAFGTTSSPAFGATNTPAFGSTTSAFGSTGSAFGVSNAPAFGSGGAFGSSNTSVFGSPSTTPFGASSTPSFGATSTPAFGASSSSAFGSASSTPAFGSASTPFGASSTPSFSFGSSPAFGQSSAAFGSTPFGSTSAPFATQSSPFGSQTATNFAGGGFGQPALGGQNGGSRVASYTPTPEADTGGGTQPGKLESISAMNVYKDKSHEELRWEDYQRGDKGGPNPAGQPSSGTGFGVSTPQSSPFASSSTFGQTASNPFSTTTPANPFGAKPSPFGGSTGFGTPSTSAFGSSAFGTSTPSNPFGQASSASPTLFSASSTAAFGSNTSSIFGASTSPSIFGSTPAPATTSSFGSSLSFANQSPSPFQPTPPSIGQTTSGFGQSSLAFGSTSSSPFGQPSFLSSNSGFGGGLFSSSSSLSSTTNVFGQTTPSFPTPSLSQPTQTSSAFSFGNFGQPQSAGLSGFGIGSSTFGQNVGQPSSSQNSALVQQPVAVTNPFGVLPAMPQMSIGRAGASPSIQYGISSMPVVDKPAPVRISSLLTSRHLSQRRIRLPARKYHPKNDKVPFFSDDEKTSSTPKADALFIPRENPRSLIIRPMDQRPSKLSPFMDTSSSMNENGKMFRGENGHISNGKVADKENKEQSNHHSSHPCNNNDDLVKNRGASTQYPSGLHGSDADENHHQKGDSYISLTGHRAGEAAIVYEHGADIEAMMPKLRHSDYYTEPRVQELAAKERAEPGFCRRVRNFVVGRHGYGSIKFLGETDVRRLDLESLIQFNNREVIVYMDDTKKPPVGQGLNKPAEVTLLNIKCYNKKTGQQYTEGPRIEKYEEMLRKKAEDQGAEFLSYEPVKGEWKFKVDHF